MDVDSLYKTSQNEIANNIINSKQNDKMNKESKSFKLSKNNKDKKTTMKFKSNLNIQNRKHLNSLIMLNNKPKFKSQKYVKDKIFLLNLPSSQKHKKEHIKIMKKSSKNKNKEENNKNNDIFLNKDNFDNLPSFTKELRKALYSKSDIDSFDNKQSKNKIDNNSGKKSHSEEKKIDNDSSMNSESEEISDGHMHEDNQTLMDVIRNKSLNEGNNIKGDEIKAKETINNEEKNNYKYPNILLTISATITEVEQIQSNIENANKINYPLDLCQDLNYNENIQLIDKLAPSTKINDVILVFAIILLMYSIAIFCAFFFRKKDSLGRGIFIVIIHIFSFIVYFIF